MIQPIKCDYELLIRSIERAFERKPGTSIAKFKAKSSPSNLYVNHYITVIHD